MPVITAEERRSYSIDRVEDATAIALIKIVARGPAPAVAKPRPLCDRRRRWRTR